MKPKKLPAEVLEYFRQQGSIGGKKGGSKGGKRSLETMTPEERSARAKKASTVAKEVKAKIKFENTVNEFEKLGLNKNKIVKLLKKFQKESTGTK